MEADLPGPAWRWLIKIVTLPSITWCLVDITVPRTILSVIMPSTALRYPCISNFACSSQLLSRVCIRSQYDYEFCGTSEKVKAAEVPHLGRNSEGKKEICQLMAFLHPMLCFSNGFFPPTSCTFLDADCTNPVTKTRACQCLILNRVLKNQMPLKTYQCYQERRKTCLP